MEDERKRLVNLFNAPAQTEDDIIERQAMQQADADEVKIGMLPPEQQEEYRRMQMQKLMNFKPEDPLRQEVMRLRGQREPTPEEQVLMEQQATQNYNSPEAQATRARFDSDERMKQGGGSNLAEAAGLLKPDDKYRRIRKYLK